MQTQSSFRTSMGRVVAISLLLLLALVGTSCQTPPRDPFITCLEGARRSTAWIPASEGTLRQFRYLGQFAPAGEGSHHASDARFVLTGMPSPRGVNVLMIHDDSGRVVATSHYYSSPPRLVQEGHLLLEDGTKIRLDRGGFVAWANGTSVESYGHFESSQ